MNNFLRERIIENYRDAQNPKYELEAFLTLREYFKSPSAQILIKYDPEINRIHAVTQKYLTAWELFRQGVADSSTASQLEEENPYAEGEISSLYQRAEEQLTSAVQILTDIGIKGSLYISAMSALSNIPVRR